MFFRIFLLHIIFLLTCRLLQRRMVAKEKPERNDKESTLMQDEFGPDILTLVDDAGEEHEFEVLDVIDNDDGCFYALLPAFSDPQDKVDAEGTYYIFESIEENGEQQLAEVEDEALLDRLAEQFESRFEELYGDECDECDEDSPEDEDSDED